MEREDRMTGARATNQHPVLYRTNAFHVMGVKKQRSSTPRAFVALRHLAERRS